jgi:tetratricopeptide (TPR) repeat protein
MEHQRSAVHRTILVVDVEGFGDQRRTNPHRLAVREGMYRVLERAFGNSGVRWTDCYQESCGDGVFVLIPAEVPKSIFIESVPHELAEALREHNAAHRAEEQIRLRMALHAGEVYYDDHGVTAASINLAFRLLDAAPLKSALAESPGALALIVSSWFFDEVVRHSPAGDAATYRPIRVAVKETTTVAWICRPDHPYPPGPGSAPLRVFLSHTSELREHPQDRSFVAAAERAVTKSGETVMNMAYFTGREDRPAAYCRTQVHSANVYVGLIGFRYGSPVKDQPDVSHTELEFAAATEQGLPRLIFLLDEDAVLPLPGKYLSDPRYDEQQRRFRARVAEAGVTVRRVGSPEQLEPLVFQALKELRQQTEQRIESGLEQQRQPERKPATRQARFVNPPPMTAPSWFQDRYVESRLIGDFLRDEGLRLLTVVGRGGVGKTAMVCRLLKGLEAGQLPDDGGELPADAIVYLSPVGIHPVSFQNLFADLTRLLPDAAAERLLQLYREPHQPGRLMLRLLEEFPGGRSIVLLDNLEDVIDPATLALSDPELGAALGELLAAPQHGVKVIATTRLVPRDLLLRHPGRQQRLDLDAGLPPAEAIKVLHSMDPAGTLGLRDASPDLLAAICDRTRGFPRALEALTAILAADRDTSLPGLLAAAENVLPGQIVQVLVGEAFERLDPLGRQVMQALAVYAVPVPPVAVDYLLQPIEPAIDSGLVLSRLVNMHFVRGDGGRYYLHQVDRDYAVSTIPPGQPEDQGAEPVPFTVPALRARAADYFEQTRTPRDSWRSLDDLGPQLAEFELRCAAADYDTAAAVLAGIDDFLQRWGHYRLAVHMHERLSGRLNRPYGQMATANALGTSYAALGQTGRAIEHYQQALAIARETGDRSIESTELGNLGNSYSTLGQTGRAVEYYQQALAIARETGDRGIEGSALGSLGNDYADLGQTDRAIEHYQQALAIARETGHRSSEGLWLGGLGGCYADLGQTERAIEHYQQALAIAIETGDRGIEGTALGNLGARYATLGRTGRAVEYYEEALAIARETGDRGSEGSWLGGLGACFADLGRTGRAVEYYEQALAIARETGDRGSEGSWLGGLGSRHADLGHAGRAVEYYGQALAIARETGDRGSEGSWLGGLGACFADLGQAGRAVEYYEQALAIARETGDRCSEGAWLAAIGNGHADLGQTKQAIDHYEEAAEIGGDLANAQVQAEAHLGLAHAHLDREEWPEARRAAEAARRHEYGPALPQVFAALGTARLRGGDHAHAYEAFSAALSAADTLLAGSNGMISVLYVKGIAQAGQAVTGEPDAAQAARRAFAKALAAAPLPGIRIRALRQFDLLAAADAGDVLAGIRPGLASPP